MSPTPVEMVAPAWIDSTCLFVNALLATVGLFATLTYVCYFCSLELHIQVKGCKFTLINIQNTKYFKKTEAWHF